MSLIFLRDILSLMVLSLLDCIFHEGPYITPYEDINM